ncbi:DUF1570 domain-containing protein [Tundrisphaera lichenicola]|uniref:DUF1570 domain-containing protein n=1 Tax=Tundrisphaera lichenicola TaxID=2029860 RepID=UPI003EB6EED3
MKSGRAVGLLALLAIGAVARGELVYFTRGGQAQLPAVVEGDSVRLDTPMGPQTFPLRDFLAILPDPDSGVEASGSPVNPTTHGTPESRFASFWRSLEDGQTSKAITILQEDRNDGSSHGPTRRALAALDQLALPCPDPDLKPLQARLRALRFRELRGDHVLLLHQGADAEARERLDLLEQVVSTFYLSLAAQGIELDPLRERIVSLWFHDRVDYRAFLTRSEAEPFLETQGYYHPILRLVVAYDTRSSQAQRSGRRAIANRRKEGESESELARQELLLDLEWRATDLGIAAHETIHQLAVSGGLTPRLDDFPNWLHEGFAAQFEVVRGGRWAGVGRVHDLRLPDWRTIRPRPRLAPLLHDVGMTSGYRRDGYAESWALVFFLRKTRPDQFRVFLDLLRSPSPGTSVRPDRAIDAFRAAFGPDLVEMERAWREYLDGLETPLEMKRPGANTTESRLARPVAGH